jgi:subtilisin family serine protease
MSFGFEREVSQVHDAIVYAYSKGVVMLAATSNDGNRHLTHIAYPASQVGLVICINSARPSGARSEFNPPPATNRDNFSILGENVKSTWPTAVADDRLIIQADGPWIRRSGTSAATPIAAAVAILVMQYKRMCPHQIKPNSRLESYNGIRRIFAKMSLDRKFEGFDNILPAAFFSPQFMDLIPYMISEELRKL